MKNSTFKKAVIYSRVSTEEQAKHDLSIPFQKDKCNEYAKREGYIVIKEFSDEGLTGTNMNRPSLLNMLEYCLENSVDAMVIHKSDRLARNMADFWAINNFLYSKNIKLLSVTEQFDDSPSGVFFKGIMSAQAQFYSANLGQEVRKGHSQKVSKGEWCNYAPLGYKNVERKVVIIPETARYVKQAFELFATGKYSIEDMYDWVQKTDMRSKRGNKLARVTINRMLRNPFYYGDFIWNDKVYKGTHEPIIDKALFDSVQSILDSRRVHKTRDRKHNFLLRGFVACECGRMFIGDQKIRHYKNGKSQIFSYFSCKNPNKNKACNNPNLKMQDVEKAMAEIFNNLEFTHEFRGYVVSEAKDIIEEVRGTETEEEKLINQRIAKLKLRMENVENERLDHVITREDFARIYERLKQDIEDSYSQLGNLTKDHSDTIKILDDVLAFTENLYQSYIDANPDNKRQILQMFISRVTITSNGVKSIQFSELTQRLIDINQVRLKVVNRDGRGSNPQPFA